MMHTNEASEVLVSIVIPFIDELDYLQEAIQSCLEQKFYISDIIVVCNEKDPIDPTVRTGILSHPDIKWLHEPRRGSAYARNAGLKNAPGHWIQFLDVDDILLPGKIEHQIVEHNIGAVVSPHLYKRLNGSFEKSKWLGEDLWSGMLNSGLGSTSSMLWNKNAIIGVGGWSDEINSHQEYDLLLRLLQAGYEIIAMENYETIVRERPSGSITQLTKKFRAKEGIALRKAMWEYIAGHSMETPERKNAFLQYVFRQLRSLNRNDPAYARQVFLEYFHGVKFTPDKINIPLYRFSYRVLGFRSTEKLLGMYALIRDKFLPFLPKNK